MSEALEKKRNMAKLLNNRSRDDGYYKKFLAFNFYFNNLFDFEI